MTFYPALKTCSRTQSPKYLTLQLAGPNCPSKSGISRSYNSRRDQKCWQDYTANHHLPPYKAIFVRLKERSLTWNIDELIDDAKLFASVNTSKRAGYYDNPLLRLHYPTTFAADWNKRSPRHPISAFGQAIRSQ